MKLQQTSWALAIALLLCAGTAFAQDQKQDTSPLDPNAPLQPLDAPPNPGYPNKPPIGVVRGATGPYEPEQYDPAQVTPDTNTLAGAAPITVGSLKHARNLFDPAITISQLGQVVPGNTGNNTLTGISMASASLSFNRVWSEYQFSTIYNGGETFNLGYGPASNFFGPTAPHYQFHDLAVTQEAAWARWHVLLRDDFTASPGAAFTSQGMGGPGLTSQFSSMLGTSLSGLAQQFEPTEFVNTGAVMRYRDSVLGQAEYSFSRRSAFTFSGSYGLLNFSGTGYFNSQMYDGQVGYDYLLDPADSIAILGTYGKIDFTGTGTPPTGPSTPASGNSVTDYGGALAFGRKITGRLAFQAAAGPQEITISTAGGTTNSNVLFVAVNTALTYEWRRSGLSLGYSRALNGGSGVLLGATSNSVSASANEQFTRYWSGSVSGGYSLSKSLPGALVTPTQFDNWFVGANIGRRLGPHAEVNFSYGATMQNNAVLCPVASCGGVGLQQTFGMSVGWHLRPPG